NALNARMQTRVEELVRLGEEEERKRGGFDLVYDGAMTELKALRDKEAGLSSEDLILERSGHHTELNTLKRQLEEVEQELEALGEADSCPVCGQDISGTNLERHKRELERKSKAAAKRQGQLDTIIAGLTTKITTRLHNLQTTRSQIDEFQRK